MSSLVKLTGVLFTSLFLSACVGGGAMDINTPHNIPVVIKALSKPLRVRVELNDTIYREVTLQPSNRGQDLGDWAPPIGSVVRVTGTYEGQAAPLRIEFVSRGNRAPMSYIVLFEEQNGLMTLSCKAPDLGPCY